MRYTGRLADAGSALSVGRRGAAYDNALAETIIGLFKTEVIRRRGPWRHIDAVEFATLAWVDWFNTRRLLEPSVTSRRRSMKSVTMSRLQWPHSRHSLSDVPGTVQNRKDLSVVPCKPRDVPPWQEARRCVVSLDSQRSGSSAESVGKCAGQSR